MNATKTYLVKSKKLQQKARIATRECAAQVALVTFPPPNVNVAPPRWREYESPAGMAEILGHFGFQLRVENVVNPVHKLVLALDAVDAGLAGMTDDDLELLSVSLDALRDAIADEIEARGV